MTVKKNFLSADKRIFHSPGIKIGISIVTLGIENVKIYPLYAVSRIGK